MENKELEFRAWHENIAVPGSNEYMMYSSEKGLTKFFAGCYDVQNSWKDHIMKYTGIKDSKGVKIFEGDIYREEFSVDDENGIDERAYYVCVWVKEWARFAWISVGEYIDYENNGIKALDESMQETFGIFEYDKNKYTVIGNIYQNKNLLKQVNYDHHR